MKKDTMQAFEEEAKLFIISTVENAVKPLITDNEETYSWLMGQALQASGNDDVQECWLEASSAYAIALDPKRNLSEYGLLNGVAAAVTLRMYLLGKQTKHTKEGLSKMGLK